MKIAVAIFHIAFLLFISYRIWQTDRSSIRKYFWPALLLKWIAGVCLGLVYTYYYTVADTFAYFQDGVRLAEVARTDFLTYLNFLWSGDDSFSFWSDLIYRQPRAMFLSKIASLFCILTFDNYWIIAVYFSTLTFATAWLLTKKIVTSYKAVELPAVFSIHFFPTAVFWSAGLIKESMAMACLFFLSVIFIKIWRKENLRWIEVIAAVINLWILWNLKYYYAAIFFPVVLTSLVLRLVLSKFHVKSLFAKVVTWFFVFIVPLLLVSLLHPNFYPARFMDVVVSNYYDFHAISDHEDLIQYHSLKATPWSILQNAPWAIVSGLFRPFLTDAKTLFQYAAAVENTILLLLMLGAFTQTRKLIRSEHRLLLFSIIIYIILLCVFLALSTPNFGTLSRYRVGFLPYLVLVLTIDNPLINKLMTLKIFRKVVR